MLSCAPSLGNTLARLAHETESEPSYIDADDTDTLCTPINFVLNRVSGSTATVMSCLKSALMAVVTNGTHSDQVKQVLAKSPGPLTATSVTDIMMDFVSLMGKI
ncbi:hypothetical protein diail_3436 [Diaporthe ilicicola]|nr:hypothetical protein diail_3436 [Diaporthe ilicicola]